jgi:hypothetical protein
VFPENTHRGDQQNMTPKELVKFMDVAVASKYGNDLSNITRVITDDVRSTLETFKTDLQNTLPKQIRSIVQQVQGEAQGNLSDLAHSTPYTVALDNTVVLPNTSTPHRGNTSGNVMYVDANSPYLGSTSMGNLGVFPTDTIPYLEAHPLWLTRVFLHTPHNRTWV